MQVNTLDDIINSYKRERRPSPAMLKQLDVVVRSLCQSTGYKVGDGLSNLSRDHMLEWRDHLLDVKKVSLSTWNNYLRHFKVLVNFGTETQCWNGAEVVRGIRNIPTESTSRTLSAQTLKTVSQFLQDPNQHIGWFWGAVVKTLYYTGMRRRQLVGLEWRDIDWQLNTIQLRSETSKTKRAWEIPLPPSLRDVLFQVLQKTTTVIGVAPQPGDQVFNVTLFNRRYRHNRMTVEHVSDAFKSINRKTGLSVSSHRFRHTFATTLANQQTGNIKIVQQLLGHRDVRTTLEYVHPDIGGMRSMVDLLPAL